MPNNSKKSLKDIKGTKIHPFSRKAAQITRVHHRMKRIAQVKKGHKDTKILPQVERYLWFRYSMDDSVMQLTLEEVHERIRDFIKRNDQDARKLSDERQRGT